jgi:hypothetical protein
MMVKLTTNICVALGLTNNTRGIIRDILYFDEHASQQFGGYKKIDRANPTPLSDIL